MTEQGNGGPLTGRAARWSRPALVGISGGLTVGILAAAVAMAVAVAQEVTVGSDFVVLRTCAEQFWRTGSPYFPFELAGSFDLARVAFIYPPSALFVVAPFAFLPAILWWAVPLGTVGWFVASDRPPAWSWPILAACVFWPRTLSAVIVGGSDMWVTAGLALALHRAWAGPLLPMLKPSVAPLALVGIRDRHWRRGLMLAVAAGIATLPLWPDYLTVLGHISVSPLYSLSSLPMYLIPVAAWAGRVGR